MALVRQLEMKLQKVRGKVICSQLSQTLDLTAFSPL